MARQHFPHDPWRIVERAPDTDENAFKESIFSLGNGYLGIRGEIEEGITAGDGFSSTCLYGVYEDEPVTHYWKRGGFVDRSALFVHAPSWLRIEVTIEGERLDTGTGSVRDYERVLDLRTGILSRSFVWQSPGGVEVEVSTKRMVSIVRDHVALMLFDVRPVNRSATVEMRFGIDGTVRNSGGVVSNWIEVENRAPEPHVGLLLVKTTTTDIHVATGISADVAANGQPVAPTGVQNRDRWCGKEYSVSVPKGAWLRSARTVAVATSRETAAPDVADMCRRELDQACAAGPETLFREQAEAWERYWKTRTLRIDGDTASQQGVHFSCFSLRQVYSGKDRTLNFVPKAYGESYGGHYFWDTEITVLPCYLLFDPETARSLLMFRYHTLDAAREKARTLRLPGALFPWYTINGREDSRIWEIHLLQVHMNSVIAWAVQRYVDFTGDTEFLARFGLEMLVEIARFWTGRVTRSDRKDKPYVINGVVGPDEYHMSVNNNAFTNAMTAYALTASADAVAAVRDAHPDCFAELKARLSLGDSEPAAWRRIAEGMYIPRDDALGIVRQDDTFLDLEPCRRADVPESDVPLQKHWPWDKVLRTRLIKQPDVVLLMNVLGDQFDGDEKRENYDFYEPICMHDSSLSPAEHAILAGELGRHDEAYRYYLNIARLDLDDYNFNTHEGLHTTNMCGTLRVIMEGFGGVRIRGGALCIDPRCPEAWTGFSFTIRYRGRTLEVSVGRDHATVRLVEGEPVSVTLRDESVRLDRDRPRRLAARP